MSMNLMGKKKGMTRVFDDKGELVVCTVIELEPNLITQIKSEKDGYLALQLGAGRLSASAKRKVTKPLQGHFEKAKVEPRRFLKESRLTDVSEYQVGQEVGLEYFQDTKLVDVAGTSKGKGYQGVMKRHGFAGGPAAHGSGFHRTAGSTGMRSTPGRSFKGHPMSGQMGNERKTTENLKIVKIDLEKKVLLVKGPIPGARESLVFVRKSMKKES